VSDGPMAFCAPGPAAAGPTIHKSEIVETGIKVIDVSAAGARRQAGLFGGAGVGKTVLLTEMIPTWSGTKRGRQHLLRHRRTLPRRRRVWYREMKDAGVLPNMVMVFGQMNEPPGQPLPRGPRALTMAEYFRDDEHRDVLLLIDQYLPLHPAGMEVSG